MGEDVDHDLEGEAGRGRIRVIWRPGRISFVRDEPPGNLRRHKAYWPVSQGPAGSPTASINRRARASKWP
jgi:hypothetical protein